MNKLLTTALTSFYNIKRGGVSIKSETTTEVKFDLSDESPMAIVSYRAGNVSFSNSAQRQMMVIHYENFLNQLAGTSFEKGRKRCDFLLYETSQEKKYIILNEQTSTLKTVSNLSKPIIRKKNGQILFKGGKYEKVELQLSETLNTLLSVPKCKQFIEQYSHKICLMSYLIKEDSPNKEVPSKAQSVFSSRYKKIESRETGENGAILACPAINSQGFEYRRISHEYTFSLA